MRINEGYNPKRQIVYGKLVETYRSEETGDEIVVEQAVRTKIGKKKRYRLISDDDFIDVLLELEPKAKDIILLMMKFCDRNTNIFDGTYKEIEKLARVSSGTVIETMKTLKQKDVIRMYRRGRWIINPELAWSVSDAKHETMCEMYNALDPPKPMLESNKKKGAAEDEL